MRREAKFKKAMFSEMPTDFILFKQYNISAKQMYQNLLALHSVDSSHQEVVSVEDIYAVTVFGLPVNAKPNKKKGQL